MRAVGPRFSILYAMAFLRTKFESADTFPGIVDMKLTT